MTSEWLPISYRDFYDIPRAVVLSWRGKTYFFDCLFDQETSEYEASYSVFRLPEELVAGLDAMSWTDLGHRGEFVARIDVDRVEFDQSKRRALNEVVMLQLESE